MSFVELLQVAVGIRNSLSRAPTVTEWKAIYCEAERQALVGVLLNGLERLPDEQKPPKTIVLQWIGVSQVIEARNRLMNERCKELSALFPSDGFKTCVLKGQGNALMYPNPLRRQSGDIDIWVASGSRERVNDSGYRDEIITYLKKRGEIGHIDVKHCDWRVFQDVEVEVHFIPTWFYNPFTNKRLQKWLIEREDEQFENSTELGMNVPNVPFNLVYSLIHIYRHLFDEGIGLRQLVDYYYILQHSSEQQRHEAMATLASFRMKRFVGAVMYVVQEALGMDADLLMCQPRKKDGQFLLDEIMKAGNFGKYDERNKYHQSRWANGLQNAKRDLRFVSRYPQEVCWMPAWKLWHWCWRKRKGYL